MTTPHPASAGPGAARAGDRSGAMALGAAAAVLAAAATLLLGPLALGLLGGAVAVYLLVRFPLALYVLFLYVGLFKGHGAIDDAPVDPTLLLGLLLAGVCALRLVEGRTLRFPPLMLILPVAVIAVLLAASLAWTPELEYGRQKAARFATLTALGTFAPFFLVGDRADLKRLLTTLAAAAALGALVVVALGTTTGEAGGRLVFNEAANTIFTSRFLLTGATVVLLGAALGIWTVSRPLTAIVGIGLVVVAFSIGSRGPLVAFFVALLCTLAALLLREPRRLLPLVLLVAAGVAVFPLISLPETSSERIERLVSDPTGAYDEDLRSRLYDKGLELAGENPVRGIGAGGFFRYSYVLTNREERYPHNVFIEAAAELGVVPALILAASILALVWLLYQRAWEAAPRDRNLLYIVAAVFLLNLFAAQFSGDFNDNKTFWAMLGLGWLVVGRGFFADAGDAQPEAGGAPA